ncbi:MAG: cupin domain-containing protein [Candidatus Methylumidiphilus sp.]
MNKRQLIERLALSPHVEGGYFRRTYQSALTVPVPYDTAPRHVLSSIYYLLTDDSPIGHLHRNRSDILHYFHGGSPLTYWIVHPDGTLDKQKLGPQLDAGQHLQILVPGGCWKATELEAGEYGLISEAVSPGFEYDDMELADATLIKSQFPLLWDRLAKFVRAA